MLTTVTGTNGTTVLIDLPIVLDEASGESERANWNHRLVIVPADGRHGSPTVEVISTYGNGTPEAIWNERVIEIANLPDALSDTAPIRKAIERHADDLLALLALHRVSWDGNRYVGGFTDADEAADLRERIERAAKEAADQCDLIHECDRPR